MHKFHYPEGTDLKVLSRNFVKEYKQMMESIKWFKENTISSEEYLSRKNKNKKH